MSAHWARMAERGSGLGLRFVVLCLRLVGRRVTGIVLYPIAFYFFLASSKARTVSQQYLRNLQASRMPQLDTGWRSSFMHIYAFAETLLDKIAAWGGQIDQSRIVFPESAAFEALRASGRGAILISAHLGNLEMARALASAEGTTVNSVVYVEHGQRFFRVLEHANPDFSKDLVHVSELGVDTAIMLKEKIDRGEFLVIVGDRTPPADNGRTVEANFLGQPAAFAVGPWLLASLLECPVYLLFCIPQGDVYCTHFELFAERIHLPRKDRQAQLQVCVQRYADRLADYCMLAPLQWFNFFDFWAKSKRSDPP